MLEQWPGPLLVPGRHLAIAAALADLSAVIYPRRASRTKAYIEEMHCCQNVLQHLGRFAVMTPAAEVLLLGKE